MTPLTRTRTVTLFVRIRLASGQRRYTKPAFTPNGRLKPHYALVDGKLEHHPEAVYTLRYKTKDGHPLWETVGSDPQLALTAKLRRENALQAEALGMPVSSHALTPRRLKHKAAEKETPGPSSLADTIAEYLREKVSKRRRTLAAYTQALSLFLQSCSKPTVSDVTKADVLAFQSFLREKGNGWRTTANRVCVLRSFMRWANLPDVVTKKEIPSFTEKKVKAYSRPQVSALLAASSPEQRLLWEFFLGSGGREQEVTYATWRDIDFDLREFTVREKLDLGFTIKDNEERSIPLPDSLLAALKQRLKERPEGRLIFPSATGKPNGHFLRSLKLTALRAGLNCGDCTTKSGRSCATHPVCKSWELHRLRKTFATLHHHAGVSARTLMIWLGHSNFETTLTYLEGADNQSEQTRSQVNRTFAGL